MSDRKPDAKSPAASASAKPKVVFNPYAKKKSAVQCTSTPATDTTNGVSKNANNSTKQINPYNKKKPAGIAQQPPQKRALKPPSPINDYATFSQVFGGKDPDANFGEEELAKQRAFDEGLVANDTTQQSGSSTNGISARDHHAMLAPNILHISTRQRGNPIIAHIRNVPHQYSTMVPDYIFAPNRCGLFLSLRYHNLHPNYIHRRIAELRSDFEYRLLLCYVDIDDNASPLLFLNDLCVQNNLILILAWSEEEAARYIETVKYMDGKDPTKFISPKGDMAHLEQVAAALKLAKGVSGPDAKQLLVQFGTFKNIANASIEQLSTCPGLGPVKIKRLRDVFHRPFSKEFSKRRKQREREKQEAELKGGEEQKDSTVEEKSGMEKKPPPNEC